MKSPGGRLRRLSADIHEGHGKSSETRPNIRMQPTSSQKSCEVACQPGGIHISEPLLANVGHCNGNWRLSAVATVVPIPVVMPSAMIPLLPMPVTVPAMGVPAPNIAALGINPRVRIAVNRHRVTQRGINHPGLW